MEWGVISFSRGSSQPGNRARVSCTAGRVFTDRAMREAQIEENLFSRDKDGTRVQHLRSAKGSNVPVLVLSGIVVVHWKEAHSFQVNFTQTAWAEMNICKSVQDNSQRDMGCWK